jgi:hypothetical protein
MNSVAYTIQKIQVGDILRLRGGENLKSSRFRNDKLEDDEVFLAATLDPLFFEGVKVVVIQTLETAQQNDVVTERAVKFFAPSVFKHHLFRVEQFEIVHPK